MPVYRINGALHYFAHVPKCGGQSVEAYLDDRVGAPAFRNNEHFDRSPDRRWSRTSPQHVTWTDFVRIVPESWIETCFAVVRHPLARLVSEYNFLSLARRALPANLGFEEWLAEIPRQRRQRVFSYDNHLRNQWEFFPETARVFRLEDGLDAVIPHIDALTGDTAGRRTMPHENSARSHRQVPSRPAPVSAASMARARDIFAEDFERFGYGPEPGAELIAHVPAESPGPSRPYYERSLMARRLVRRLTPPPEFGVN